MKFFYALLGVGSAFLSVTLFFGLAVQFYICITSVALYQMLLTTKRSKWLIPFVIGLGLGIDLFGTYKLGTGVAYSLVVITLGEAAMQYMGFAGLYWRFVTCLLVSTVTLLLLFVGFENALSSLSLTLPALAISLLWAYSAHSANVRASHSLL